jgi:shikimate dehydrogenase
VIGAANYVTFEDGSLIGHNNDGKGVVKAIQKVTPISSKRVAMLGAGGAGRAMAVEIARAGAEHLTVITRRESQGREVADLVHRATGVPTEWLGWKGTVRLPKGIQILLNATHLGAAPEIEPVPVAWNSIADDATLVDVITNPRITPFLEAARKKGSAVVDGVEMLVQLALHIFQAWTSIVPDEEVFQKAVAAALAE